MTRDENRQDRDRTGEKIKQDQRQGPDKTNARLNKWREKETA